MPLKKVKNAQKHFQLCLALILVGIALITGKPIIQLSALTCVLSASGSFYRLLCPLLFSNWTPEGQSAHQIIKPMTLFSLHLREKNKN